MARADIEVRYPDGTVEQIEYVGCSGFLEECLHLLEMYCAAAAGGGNSDSVEAPSNPKRKVYRETSPRLYRPLDHILRFLMGHSDEWLTVKEIGINFGKTRVWAMALIRSGSDRGFVRLKKVHNTRTRLVCQIADKGLEYIRLVEKF